MSYRHQGVGRGAARQPRFQGPKFFWIAVAVTTGVVGLATLLMATASDVPSLGVAYLVAGTAVLGLGALSSMLPAGGPVTDLHRPANIYIAEHDPDLASDATRVAGIALVSAAILLAVAGALLFLGV